MPQIVHALGGAYDVGTSAEAFQLSAAPHGDARFSILNKGAATVYLEWESDTVDANTDEKDRKCWLETGDAVRVPGGATKFAVKTASGSAKILIVQH